MACFGSKPLRKKTLKSNNLDEMNKDDNLSKRRKMNASKKPDKGNGTMDTEESSTEQCGAEMNKELKKFKKQHRGPGKDGQSRKTRTQMPAKSKDATKQKITLRKKVDPETAKYFTEIAKLFESNEVDLDERSSICGNALEETRGKELELATDMIISHTLEILLEGCDLEQLCGFLQNCAKEFPSVAMDKFGSHVAEIALKTLTKHHQDEESISMIEDTLTKICQMVVLDVVNVMCCHYGSHVLRSLLCLSKGVPADTLQEFHVTKPSAILAERLNCMSAQPSEQNIRSFQRSFTNVFNFLIREMLNHSKDEITTMRVNKYSSFVLQTALKLLVDDDQELLHAILIILGCKEKNTLQGKFIESETKHGIIALLEDTAFSHLFEVIIEVAPVTIYDEFLNKVFKWSLFEISSLQCGNFVVQALVASAKTNDQKLLGYGNKQESSEQTSFKRRMKRGNCNELGYDPHEDFYKFLEEARKHSISSLPSPTSVARPVAAEATKTGKKSWRRCLSSWWKLNKKKSSAHEDLTLTDGTRVPTRESSSVSGPISGGGGRLGLIRRPTSGPLAECFAPTRVEENELQYVCLSRHKCSSGVESFGPIYLVT